MPGAGLARLLRRHASVGSRAARPMPILSMHSVMAALPDDRFGTPREDGNDNPDCVRFGLAWLGDC